MDVGSVALGSVDKVLVRNVLEHADDFAWTLQELGLLGLRLDARREHRLHVWAPERRRGRSVIHDHPYDFHSRVIAGELTNIRFIEDPNGATYRRDRYFPPDEHDRTTDSVRLTGTSETYREGDAYIQRAHELHDSDQVPGTVTLLHMAFQDERLLTVCRPEGTPWISGKSRPATSREVREITEMALAWF